MKKIVLLCLMILVISEGTWAQNKRPGHQLSIAPGLAIPVGKYGSKQSFREGDAFAKAGPAFFLRYQRTLNARWSLTAGLLGQINALNSSAIEESFARELYLPRFYFSANPGMPAPGPGNRYSSWQLERKQWLLAALLIGAEYRLPLDTDGRNYWTINAAVGPAFVRMPALAGQAINDTTAAFVSQEKGSGIGAVFSIGTGLQMQLSPNWVLMPGIRFWKTNNVKLKDVRATITETRGQPGLSGYSISQASFTGTLHQQLSSFWVSVGVGYRFN